MVTLAGLPFICSQVERCAAAARVTGGQSTKSSGSGGEACSAKSSTGSSSSWWFPRSWSGGLPPPRMPFRFRRFPPAVGRPATRDRGALRHRRHARPHGSWRRPSDERLPAPAVRRPGRLPADAVSHLPRVRDVLLRAEHAARIAERPVAGLADRHPGRYGARARPRAPRSQAARRALGDAHPLLSLPPATDEPVRGRDRVSVYLLLAIPWALAFEAVCRLGIPTSALVAVFPFERSWPVLEWTQIVYGSTYLFVLATPFVVRTRRTLREVAILGLVSTAAVTLVYLAVPVISPPRPFTPGTALGRALMIERCRWRIRRRPHRLPFPGQAKGLDCGARQPATGAEGIDVKTISQRARPFVISEVRGRMES
jgi:hypothetical protein